ncbi:MoaD/ThiS family protein [Conexibacter sp. DBS9H8]|uniref:MoaD/ThiS family protein n=1 Tax=Conexibacter sp. DBS9H8 TaxID=2937801 RepID=UPI00200FE1E6|nr:MoaD/ThiS family protein [Conexibacter sp. DBS9H8]
MAVICVRGPIRRLAGDQAEHALAAGTVREGLSALERTHPPLRGWILDEQGRVRRHINIYVNGERAEAATALAPSDRVDVVPAITGG